MADEGGYLRRARGCRMVSGNADFGRIYGVHWQNSHIKVRATTFVIRRMGGSCAQADKPEIQEPGRPEGLPHTAAIARNCGHKKNACNRGWGAVAPASYAGYQARSLNWQRRLNVSLKGEAAQSWLGGGVGVSYGSGTRARVKFK